MKFTLCIALLCLFFDQFMNSGISFVLLKDVVEFIKPNGFHIRVALIGCIPGNVTNIYPCIFKKQHDLCVKRALKNRIITVVAILIVLEREL